MSGFIGPKPADVPVGTISTKGTVSANVVTVGPNNTINTSVATFLSKVSVGADISDFTSTGKNATLALSGTVNLEDGNPIAWGGTTVRPYIQGNKASGYLAFGTPNVAGSGTQEVIRIDNSGYVGIGNSSPADKLSVNGTTYFNNTKTITKSSTYNSEVSGALYVRNSDSANGVGMIFGADAAANAAYIQSIAPATSYGTRYLLINPNGGNVGIGNVSPSSKLFVQSVTNDGVRIYDGTVTTILFNTSSSSGSVGTISNHGFGFYTNNAQRGAFSAAGDFVVGAATDGGNTLRYFDLQNANTGTSAGAIMRFITANSSGGNPVTVDMVKYRNGSFYINNNDGSGSINLGTAGTDRMTIASDGTVSTKGALIVGNTAYSSATNSISLNNGRIMMTKNDDWGIEMAGSNGTRIRFYANNGGQATTVGSIQVDNVTARYYAGSLQVNYSGITFPSTPVSSSDVNCLDDYEEGTWTPSSSTGGLALSTNRSTHYTKVGRLLTAYVYADFNNTSGSTINAWLLTGLPFVCSAGYGSCFHYYGSNLNSNGACYVESGQNYAIINHPIPTGISGQMFAFMYYTST